MTDIIPARLPSIDPSSTIPSTYEVSTEGSLSPPMESEPKESSDYGQNIKNIHRMALNVMRLQETAKTKGLNAREEAAYREYMESLNKSAHNLAKIYEGDDDDLMANSRAGLSGWFARKKSSKKDKRKEEEDKKRKAEEETKKKDEEEKKRKDEEEKKRKEEEEKKRKEEEEKKKKEEENHKEEMENEDDDETVVNPEETSVAEAKPVGLAVAGIGGVAASKPIATAVVGPGGLAIARPVGTAIAGVSPDQALVPIYAEGFVVPAKPNNTKGEKKYLHSTEYLNKIISKYHQS